MGNCDTCLNLKPSRGLVNINTGNILPFESGWPPGHYREEDHCTLNPLWTEIMDKKNHYCSQYKGGADNW